MATGFLILHGVENHRPPEHWQSLLLATLEQELAALGGEQRVVVCHSLACLL